MYLVINMLNDNEPAVGGFNGVDAVFLSGFADEVHGFKEALLPVAFLVVGPVGKAAVGRIVLKGTVAAGEKSARQRVVGVEAHAEMVEAGVQLSLGFAGQGVVDALEDGGFYPAAAVADVPDVRDHPGGEIGEAQFFIFALSVEVCHGFQNTLHRGFGVREVQVDSIYGREVHPFEGFVHLFVGCFAVQPAADPGIDLGGDPVGASETGKHFPEEPLAGTIVVDIGGVQFFIARVQKSVDKFSCLGVKDGFPEGHGAQDQFYFFHSLFFLFFLFHSNSIDWGSPVPRKG